MSPRPIAIRRLTNFRQLVIEAGSAAELARRAGKKDAQMSHIERGVRGIGDDMASTLEAAMDKPPGWMDQDHGPEVVTGDRITRRVPLIAWAQVRRRGEPMDLDGIEQDGASWVVHPDASLDEGAFALRVRGDSMVNSAGEPSFPDGCIIVVDPSVKAAPGDHVVVKLSTASDAVFKTLEFDGQQQFLKPLNSRYPISPLPADAQIIGVVVSVQNHQAIVPRSKL